ncbi:hypothetical protein ROTAS13_03127 [Roseomonas sp. TAS13]|nr:hypothetical protein ROTAS13_03127 [Roseomonas sp. TAS13]
MGEAPIPQVRHFAQQVADTLVFQPRRRVGKAAEFGTQTLRHAADRTGQAGEILMCVGSAGPQRLVADDIGLVQQPGDLLDLAAQPGIVPGEGGTHLVHPVEQLTERIGTTRRWAWRVG